MKQFLIETSETPFPEGGVARPWYSADWRKWHEDAKSQGARLLEHEGTEWLSQKWAPSDDERKAVKYYTGSGSKNIATLQLHSEDHLHNSWLGSFTGAGYSDKEAESNAKRLVQATKDAIPHIESVLQRAPHTPEDIHTFSGVSEELGKHLQRLPLEKTLQSKTYISSSLNPLTSLGFGRMVEGVKPIVHFHIPKGIVHGRFIDDLSSNRGEHEYLLPRGVEYRLTGVHDFVNESSDYGARGMKNRVFSMTPVEKEA